MKAYIVGSADEKQAISWAQKLGFSGLCVLLTESAYRSAAKKTSEKHGFTVEYGVLADAKNAGKLRQKLGTEVFIAVCATKACREWIERGSVDCIFDFEQLTGHDFMHHRASGLNQVLCKLMAQKKVAYGICLQTVLNSSNRSQVFGRITQNLSLCKKYKVPIVVSSFGSLESLRSPHDMRSLFSLLGADTAQQKQIFS